VTKRVLITGAAGCIGAWLCRGSLDRGWSPVAVDIDTTYARWSLIMDRDQIGAIPTHRLDIADAEALLGLVESEEIDQIIHTAALQVPLNRADPTRGALVNVVGTVNMFESTRRAELAPLVYASSVAIFGPAADYPSGIVPSSAPAAPSELYGVNKVCNEGTARVYWEKHQVPSVGVRPHTVYGPGRDAGMTSEPTRAILAAFMGEKYHIGYGGRSGFQYVEDVADLMLDASSRPDATAKVYNMAGQIASMEEFVAAVHRIVSPGEPLISYEPGPLDLPAGMDDGDLRADFGDMPDRSLDEGVAETVRIFAAVASL
jgi:nucleoside-diphosphate-sugar epimerase